MQDVVRGDKPDVVETRVRGRGGIEAGPLFREGELIELRGVDFRLVRINKSSLVLRPIVDDVVGSARRVIRELTAEGSS